MRQLKIRFKKYNDVWENVKLTEAAPIVMGQSPDSKNYTDNPNDYILVQGNADMQNGRVVPRVWTTQITKLAEKGDLILSVRAPVGDIGKTDYNVVLGRGVAAIKGNEFIFQLLSRMKQFNYWSKLSTGSTFESINSSDIKSTEIYLPSQDEQSAIGSLFRILDDLLASYKDNLANYQSLKATMISKMFPKAGHTVPEIRLDGFKGEWENSKISDYVYLLNGRAFKQDELLNEGKYRVVRVGNFNTNEKWYYSNLELEENKYANKDDLLYLWATNFGPEIWKEEKIIFHYHIWKLEFDRSIIDRNYLYYWLEKDKKRIQQNTNGSTMVHVTKSMMENREFLFPMFREQQAIGSYFSNLDNLIAAHQEKISQLETLKKKLLQDMFI